MINMRLVGCDPKTETEFDVTLPMDEWAAHWALDAEYLTGPIPDRMMGNPDLSISMIQIGKYGVANQFPRAGKDENTLDIIAKELRFYESACEYKQMVDPGDDLSMEEWLNKNLDAPIHHEVRRVLQTAKGVDRFDIIPVDNKLLVVSVSDKNPLDNLDAVADELEDMFEAHKKEIIFDQGLANGNMIAKDRFVSIPFNGMSFVGVAKQEMTVSDVVEDRILAHLIETNQIGNGNLSTEDVHACEASYELMKLDGYGKDNYLDDLLDADDGLNQ